MKKSPLHVLLALSAAGAVVATPIAQQLIPADMRIPAPASAKPAPPPTPAPPPPAAPAPAPPKPAAPAPATPKPAVPAPPAKSVAPPPPPPPTKGPHAKQMTIKVMNHHTADIKTYRSGDPVAGNPQINGVIAKGQQAQFVVNAGWHGTIAVNDAKFRADTGDESQIEGSFVDQGQGVVGDVNISMVNGFSLPIICWCDANQITTGCSKDLSKLSNCPAPNGQGSCKNPLRVPFGKQTPTPFFAPCQAPGGAYTYPSDDDANNLNGKCQQEQYTCCVGTDCKKYP